MMLSFEQSDRETQERIEQSDRETQERIEQSDRETQESIESFCQPQTLSCEKLQNDNIYP